MHIDTTQIAQYAYNAGFRGNDLDTAVAVALAESNGEQYAKNFNDNGSIDLGLWQINTIHAPDQSNLPNFINKMGNPQINANTAFQIYQSAGNSFSPWVAYKNNSYKNFIDVAKKAVSEIGNVVSDITDALLNTLHSFYSHVITQGYGPTDLSLEPAYDGYAHFHQGVDLGVASGTKLPTLLAGKVSKIVTNCSSGDYSCGGGYGNQIWVTLSNGEKLLYGHLQTVDVKVGDTVSIGDIIGVTNNTGASTGAHVHIGLEDLKGNWRNPTSLIQGIAKSKLSDFSDQGAGGLFGMIGDVAGFIGDTLGNIPNPLSPIEKLYDIAKQALDILTNALSYITDPKKRPILIFIIMGIAITLYSLRGMIMETDTGKQIYKSVKSNAIKAAKVAAIA